jgi:hypothetical protein
MIEQTLLDILFATWHFVAMAGVIYVSLSSESEDEDVKQFSEKKRVAKKQKSTCQVIRALAKLRRSSTWTTRRAVFKEYASKVKQSEEVKWFSSKAECEAKVKQREEAWGLQSIALTRPNLRNTCNLRH